MRLILSSLTLLTTTFIFGQKQMGSFFRDSTIVTVIVNKDPRLDILAAKQGEINKRTARLISNGQVRGYRIQVINTANRDEANQVKAEMLRRFPDEKAYLLYQAPNFRVRVGNFRKQ